MQCRLNDRERVDLADTMDVLEHRRQPRHVRLIRVDGSLDVTLNLSGKAAVRLLVEVLQSQLVDLVHLLQGLEHREHTLKNSREALLIPVRGVAQLRGKAVHHVFVHEVVVAGILPVLKLGQDFVQRGKRLIVAAEFFSAVPWLGALASANHCHLVSYVSLSRDKTSVHSHWFPPAAEEPPGVAGGRLF